MNLVQLQEAASLGKELEEMREAQRKMKPVPDDSMVHVTIGRVCDFTAPNALLRAAVQTRIAQLGEELRGLGVTP